MTTTKHNTDTQVLRSSGRGEVQLSALTYGRFASSRHRAVCVAYEVLHGMSAVSAKHCYTSEAAVAQDRHV